MNDHCHGIISLNETNNEISKYNPVFHLSICKRDSEIINILKKKQSLLLRKWDLLSIQSYERFLKFIITRDL